jgi:hypothetical protein
MTAKFRKEKFGYVLANFGFTGNKKETVEYFLPFLTSTRLTVARIFRILMQVFV